MLRVALHALVNRGSRWFFAAEAFSGMAFHIHYDRSVTSMLIKDGILSGAAQSTLPLPPQIDATGLLAENAADMPMRWNGELFTGVAYEFNLDRCVHEVSFDAGKATRERWWNGDGALLSDGYFGPAQRLYEWHQNGNPKSASIDVAGRYALAFGFDPEGRLNAMSARGDGTGWLDLEHPEGFDLPVDKLDFDRLHGAPAVYLSGENVDDTVLQRLIDLGVLRKTQRLELADTSVTAHLAPELAAHLKLGELVIVAAGNAQLSLAKEAASLGCKVSTR